MSIYEYSLVDGERCCKCRTVEDVVMNEDGDSICTECLFEQTTTEMWDHYMEDEDL